MDYRNIKRICLFDMAIEKYNRPAIVPLKLAHVQMLYALCYLTRNRPTTTASVIRRQFTTRTGAKYSLQYVLSTLHEMEVGHLVTHFSDNRNHFYWSLTLPGHNAMKSIERLIRLERFDHRII